MSVLAARRTAATRPCSCPQPLPCECSYLTLLRARARAARTAARGEPLLRNGHILAASSLLAAGLGSMFWILATRSYSAETVGRSYAALAAASFLSTLGSFNLGDVLVRFVPTAGRHTRRLVLRCYTASAVFSALAAGGFLLLIPLIAPGLGYLREPVVAVAFMAATAGYALFVLQDGALTGLRRTGWVLGENALFAVAKSALLALCAILAVGTGILVSWSVALVLSIVLTNLVLFGRAMPAGQSADASDTTPPQRVARYATADYVGNLCSVATYSVVPLLVLNHLGAGQSAYYSLAFIIADTLYVAAFSMGHSLIVEGADAPERLVELARHMLRHSALLLAGAVAVVVAAAPWILQLFGPDYASHGTTVLRLMVLAAVPNAVLSVGIQVARVRRSATWMIGLRLAFAVVVIGLTAGLLPVLGLTGVGLAWLAAECVLALPLLLTLQRWLPTANGRPT
ncbi:lipopolysaccharide biosynthesis protein [Kitasatospora sp. NPDC057015]|uniref:lipopolysaccharide biosynthesis protein n=1 Tax=Kitasatospora sp. NPDC057015 TaxID=3346001 RepID=UPI0036296CA2